jgi:hypothetical protein
MNMPGLIGRLRRSLDDIGGERRNGNRPRQISNGHARRSGPSLIRRP